MLNTYIKSAVLLFLLLPTSSKATELFDAHEKCEALASKMIDTIPSAKDPNFMHSFASHYDHKTGNCYLKHSRWKYRAENEMTLYDAFTTETLASYSPYKLNGIGSYISDYSYGLTDEGRELFALYAKDPKRMEHPALHYISMRMSSGR